jgi:L,D-transpeptidase YcbB
MFLKFGSRSNSRSLLASVALLAFVFTATTILPSASFAEEESAMDILRKKRKLKKLGLLPNTETTSKTLGKKKKLASQAPLTAVTTNTKATTTTDVVADKTVRPMITDSSSELLQAALSRYESIAASGGWPKVSKGTYKKGGQSKNIVALNKRLLAEGYVGVAATEGEFAQTYTSATEEGVKRFQRNMGLPVSGKVDGLTINALNVSVNSRIAAIRANIPRLATYAENLGERYVIVNIPAQQIETVNGGRVFSQHNAIVGRPERPTPVVMTALSDINFNPYWNAPPSIIERDLIPKMIHSTDILRQMNIRVFQGFGGPEIDPDTVDWSRAVADNYHFRQEPGGANAMKTTKINFSSPFGIYLHDTPEPHLFKTGNRFYSSGCVRVEQVGILNNWILNGQDGYNSSRISDLAESLERVDVKLVDPPQLRVAYLTAWPAAGNTVAFRSDIYELDGTGFTVGQPMPVGELSPDGQRYTLTPIARQPNAVDADEADNFGIFGRSFKKTSAKSNDEKKTASVEKAKPSLFASKKTIAAVEKKKPKREPFKWGGTKKTPEELAKLEKAKKLTTKAKAVVAKTKVEDKTKVVAKATVKVKPIVDPKKKPINAAKPTEVAKKVVPIVIDKKTAVAAKATDATKKIIPPTADKKPIVAAKPKPVVKPATPAKKPAVDCKLDAEGKLPAGCKPVTAQAVPKPKAPTTAAN